MKKILCSILVVLVALASLFILSTKHVNAADFNPTPRNKVANWDFETDASGYTPIEGATLTSSDAYAYHGSKSMLVSGGRFQVDGAIQPGKSYVYSFYVYTAAEGGADFEIEMQVWGPTDGDYGQAYVGGGWTHLDPGAWQFYSIEFSIEEEAGVYYLVKDETRQAVIDSSSRNVATVNVARMFYGATPGKDLYFDCLTLIEQQENHEFTPEAGNKVSNWDFESDATGYSPIDGTVGVSDDYAYHGNKSLHPVGGRFQVDGAVEVGKSYIYSFYVYTDNPGGVDFEAEMQLWGPTSDNWGSAYTGSGWTHLDAGAWRQYTIEFSIEEEAGVFYLVVGANKSPVVNGETNVLTVDTARMFYGASAGSVYFDCLTLTDVTPAAVHTCGHVCPACGKCTDPSCLDPACSDKCLGHAVPDTPHEFTPTPGNKVLNWDVETNTGYSGNGATVEASAEHLYHGTKSLKVSNRTAGETWPGFNSDVTYVKFGKKYEYSFYAYAENGADIIALISPWGWGTTNYTWVYVSSDWAHANAGEWTRFSLTFELRKVDNAYYVVTTNGAGVETLHHITNDAVEEMTSFDLVRLSFGASAGETIYFDCITLVELFEEPETNKAVNWDVETIDGYTGNGCTAALSEEQAMHGTHSLKLSGRTEAWNGFNIDVTGVKPGYRYTYSFYVYSENNVDIQTTLSPWGRTATENYAGNYSCCDWMTVPGGVWTEVTQTFELRKIGEKYVIVTISPSGAETSLDIMNGSENMVVLDLFRLSCAASATAEFYVDCITLTEGAHTSHILNSTPIYEAGKDGHFHKCDYCDYTDYDANNIQIHTFGDWATVSASSCTVAGSKKRICSACGYEDVAALDLAEHDFNTPALYDAGKLGHFHKCANCEATDYDENSIQAHTFGEWDITLAATEEAPGSKERTCTACSYKEVQEIPQLAHTHHYAEEWTKDASGHWHICSGCTEKGSFAEHTFGEWTIVVAATCTAKGSEKRVCTVCGYEATRETEMISHAFDTTPIYAEGKVGHFHKCANCEATDYDVDNVQEHTFGGWVTVTPSTSEVKGSEKRECTACGFVEVRELPLLPHEYAPLPGNKVANWDLEELGAFTGNGCSIALSTEHYYHGSNSLKVSSRSAGQTWPGFSVDVSGVKVGKRYVYSFYVLTEVEAAVQTTMSPWGQSSHGNWVWVYSCCDWVGTPANTWTLITQTFEVREVEGKFYVVNIASDGTETPFQIKDYNGEDEDLVSLGVFRLSCAASADVDLYVDCLTLVELYEEPDGNKVSNWDLEAIDGFTGNGCTVELSDEFALHGTHSLKLSGRTEVWNGFNIDVTGVKPGYRYTYSFYVYAPTGADIQTTLSPWGRSANEQYTYNYSCCNWLTAPAGTWTEVTQTFELRKVGESYFIVTNPGTGSEVSLPIKSDGGEEMIVLDVFRLSCAATADKVLYVDCVTLSEGEHTAHILNSTPIYADGKDGHFHKCDYCDYTDYDANNIQVHTFGEWQEVFASSCTVAGSEKRICTACGYEDVAALELAEHDFNTPALHADGKFGHFHKCANCEATDYDENNIQAHTFGDWNVTVPATESSKGSQERECSACGFKEVQEIPETTHVHNYAEEWAKDASGHWHECSGCTEKGSFAEHTFGEWTTVVAATCTAKGSEKRECTVCGFEATRETEMIAHDFNTPAIYADGKVGHFHKCANCDATDYDVNEPQNHTFGEWTLVQASTSDVKGSEKRVCTLCGFAEVRELPLLPHDFTPEQGNKVENWDLEAIGSITGVGAQVAITDEHVYHGEHSLKVSSRQSGETWPGFQFDVLGAKMNKRYTYSFYVYSDAEIDVQTTLSPWGKCAAGGYVWVYSCCDWTHVPAETWTLISQEFEVKVIEGKYYVVVYGADDAETLFQIKDWNGGENAAEDLVQLDLFRLSCAATAGEDLYIDCITLVEDGATDPVVIVPPTGHAGGEDASLIPGNMMQNATFDTKLFTTELNGDGIWYYTSPEKISLCDTYSQDGDEYGSSALLSNRQWATASFMCRSLNIWVSNQYKLSGYVSSLQATKGSIVVKMWAYYDEYTDANPEARYPYAEYVLPIKEVKPGEWTYFETTFGWKYDAETQILTLQIYDYDTKEVVAEYPTTKCSGLSSFEFEFRTDFTDENYLTDLYFDNYTLLNVSKYIQNIPDDEDPDNPDEPDEPVIIDPEEPVDPEEPGKDKPSAGCNGGCKSVLTTGFAAFFILGAAVIVLKKKKENE